MPASQVGAIGQFIGHYASVTGGCKLKFVGQFIGHYASITGGCNWSVYWSLRQHHRWVQIKGQMMMIEQLSSDLFIRP